MINPTTQFPINKAMEKKSHITELISCYKNDNNDYNHNNDNCDNDDNKICLYTNHLYYKTKVILIKLVTSN